jgi:predicted PurR-regulated permease PerM
LILDVEYALILALVAFICEFVPYIGPMIAAVAAIFVAFIESPLLALFVLVLFIVIQQAENHILVPRIMQQAVGLNPIISIIAVMIGFKLAGLVGIILAIPVATAIGLIAKELYSGTEFNAAAVRTRMKKSRRTS